MGVELNGRTLRYFGVWLFLGWCLVALVVYLSLMPTPPELDLSAGDKYGHFLAYFTLMMWFLQLYERQSWWILAAALVGLGLTLEAMQGLLAYRTFDFVDFGVNGIGVMVAWLVGVTPAGAIIENAEMRCARRAS